MRKISTLSDVADQLSGSKHLIFHPSVSEPSVIGQQLINHADLWPGLHVETFMPGAHCHYLGDDRISVSTTMPGGVLRHAVNNGQVQINRESLFEQAQIYASQRRMADIVVLQISPADDHGFHSVGPGVGAIPQLLEQNPFVIAVINPQVPHTNYTIPSDSIDACIDIDTPLPNLGRSNIDHVDQMIADQVIAQLSDGISIEIGMGSTPDAITKSLSRLKSLRIHTGLINDTIMQVVESGATSEPVTTTMALGTNKFYRWLDGNASVDFRPIVETHDPKILGQIPKFHTINAALQVDLAGNVNAERIGERVISCPGGLPDFTAGARRSRGGCNIIVLRATAGRNSKSTIVPKLDFKTLDGSFVDLIVTEHGTADLRGLNKSQRATTIALVAASEHQEALKSHI